MLDAEVVQIGIPVEEKCQILMFSMVGPFGIYEYFFSLFHGRQTEMTKLHSNSSMWIFAISTKR